MPIRPSERTRYPSDWKAISMRIRERAGQRCECEGECGLHTTTGRCVERNGEPARFARGRVVLTVAHLDHTPENCADDNLKAMCQRCHLRYDRDHHAANSAATRRAKSPQRALFLALLALLPGLNACPNAADAGGPPDPVSGARPEPGME